MGSPSTEQKLAISVAERVCSAVSLVGTFVIVTTFIGSRLFRKPINRLVFYASWGNIMTNIATLISQDGIHSGGGSPLCQFQAFLIQWFMPADALWTFAMACNVYLTFFYKYDSDQLRHLEWKYLLFCYGLPFIPAFTYFFIKTDALGRIYGSAILWCWVSKSWDWLRIAIFYGPVWLVITLTFAIYIRAGSVIYQKRRQFRNIGNIDSFDSERADSGTSPLVKRIGIQVTSEIAYSVPEHLSLTTPNNAANNMIQQGRHSPPNFSPYSVTIQGGGQSDPTGIFQGEITPIPSGRWSNPRPNSGVIRDGHVSNGDRLQEAHSRRATTGENSSATWAYAKCAMLFFIALLVTWVPSTVNRVVSLARPDEFSFGLNFTSSFVLPLQGFWNSLIYVSISWPAFKVIWKDFRQSSTQRKTQASLP